MGAAVVALVERIVRLCPNPQGGFRPRREYLPQHTARALRRARSRERTRDLPVMALKCADQGVRR